MLALVCCVQRWQSCSKPAAVVPVQIAQPAAKPSSPLAALASSMRPPPQQTPQKIFGVRPPTWAAPFLPQPGEKPSAYRDRIVPLVELVVAPQRARVERIHDQLPEAQRLALDAAAGKTAQAIQDRITAAVMDGELQAMKPMQGVTLAREVLDLVDQGNTEMVGSLTAEQREQLATSHFDFAEYLALGTHWEDALHH
ncbi:MAG TPA: hypothetical protein VGC41_01035 [Kofleriaceae bacterium]